MSCIQKTGEKEKTKSIIGFWFRRGQKELLWFCLALGATLISVAANFMMPQVISVAVDHVVVGGGSPSANVLVNRLWGLLAGLAPAEALLYCAVAVLALSALSGGFNFLARTGMARATETFIKNLRDALFRHTQYLPFKWHVENPTGDIIQRCTSDLDVIRTFLAAPMLDIVRTLILVVTALGLMFSMNVKLTLVAVAFLPLIGGYSLVMFRLVGKRFLEADEAEGDLTVMVQENLTGVRVVRAFGREGYEVQRFDKLNERFAALWLRLGSVMSVFWGIGDLVSGLQILTIIVAGGLLAIRGELSLGAFMVFVYYNQTLAWPVRSLGRALSEMSKTGVSVARIEEILDAAPEQEKPDAQTPSLHCDIHFEHVTFSYDNQPVLQDLSFTIPRGSTFGILGAAGSGKSTITYLLNRLYDLPEGCGHIRFGETDSKDIDRYYLRRQVGLVLQEPFLFSKTIEENIAIGREGAGRREVRLAAGIAAVDEAIGEFSGGYETVVGERGVTLSGGQKQRVAIARTLMLEAPVMIFDDSMSAVDLETDARIRAALRENTAGATVILISHRINTLMKADKILVLEGGRATALGSHAELTRQPGLYRRIYEMQTADDGMPLPEKEAPYEQ